MRPCLTIAMCLPGRYFCLTTRTGLGLQALELLFLISMNLLPGRRALAKNFFMLMDSYQNHPEAKSLGPTGKPCEFDTRGLLQRAHVIANWPPIYIGKESDKHWEEGEDLALLEFKAIRYSRSGMAVADDEQLARIAQVPKREFMRRGINQHTLEKICNREPVRAVKLAKCLKILNEIV